MNDTNSSGRAPSSSTESSTGASGLLNLSTSAKASSGQSMTKIPLWQTYTFQPGQHNYHGGHDPSTHFYDAAWSQATYDSHARNASHSSHPHQTASTSSQLVLDASPRSAASCNINQPLFLSNAEAAASETDGRAGCNFPPSLNRYVQKCLKSVAGNQERTLKMRVKLKEIIASAITTSVLWLMNWDLETTPSLEPMSLASPLLASRSQLLAGSSDGPCPAASSSLRAAADASWSTTQAVPSLKQGRSRGFTSAHLTGQPTETASGIGHSRYGRSSHFGTSAGSKSSPVAGQNIHAQGNLPEVSHPYQSGDIRDTLSREQKAASMRSSRVSNTSRSSAGKRSRWDKTTKSAEQDQTSGQIVSAKRRKSTLCTDQLCVQPPLTSKKQKPKKAGATGGSKDPSFMRRELRKVQKISLNTDDEEILKSLNIKGTCQGLEKDFYRLTKVPLPEEVRPRHILVRAFARLRALWDEHKDRIVSGAEQPAVIELTPGENPIVAFNKELADRSINYEYVCSQVKAIRQDLRIQRINDLFAVEVYETHARWALQCRDMNEYAGCQTRLAELYNSGLRSPCAGEFMAYNLLYLTTLTLNKKGNQAASAVLKLLREIVFAGRAKPQASHEGVSGTPARDNPNVRHALQVRAAVVDENHPKFFKLVRETPGLGGLILRPLVYNFRALAVARVVKAFKPSVPVSLVARQVGFEDRIEECKEFVRQLGVPMEADGDIITKNVVVDLSRGQIGANLL